MDIPEIERYIAGNTISEVLDRARLLNKEGIGTLLSPLDRISIPEESISERVGILKSLSKEMGMKMIRGGISVRLSDFGFLEDPKEAVEQFKIVIRAAEEYSLALWIDMEDGVHVGPILDAYIELRKLFPHLSITLQSRLDRTAADLRRVITSRGRVRLVKGEYPIGAEPGASDPDEIRRRYMRDMELLFSEGAMFAIATHDEVILESAARLQKNHPRMMEFQMYLGFREDRIRTLLYEGGFPVTLYLPFGRNPDKHLKRTGVLS
ncbi:MAG: proline dehydrogenase family protein [Leptospirales bacterium]